MKIDSSPVPSQAESHERPTAPLASSLPDVYTAGTHEAGGNSPPASPRPPEVPLPRVPKPSRLRVGRNDFFSSVSLWSAVAGVSGLAGIACPPLLGVSATALAYAGFDLSYTAIHDLCWRTRLPKLRAQVAETLQANGVIDQASNRVVGRDLTPARLDLLIRPVYYASDAALNELSATLQAHATRPSGACDLRQVLDGLMDVDRPAVMHNRVLRQKAPPNPAPALPRPETHVAAAPLCVPYRETIVPRGDRRMQLKAMENATRDDHVFAMLKARDVQAWLLSADLLTETFTLRCAPGQAHVMEALEAAGLFQFGWPRPRAAQAALAEALLRLHHTVGAEARAEALPQVMRVLTRQINPEVEDDLPALTPPRPPPAHSSLPRRARAYKPVKPARLRRRLIASSAQPSAPTRDVFILNGLNGRQTLHVFGQVVGTGRRGGEVRAGVVGPEDTPVALKATQDVDVDTITLKNTEAVYGEYREDEAALYREARAQARTSGVLAGARAPMQLYHGPLYRSALVLPLQSGALSDCLGQMTAGLQPGSVAYRARHKVVLKTVLCALLEDLREVTRAGYAHTDIRADNILFSHRERAIAISDRGHMVAEGQRAIYPAAAPHSAPERLSGGPGLPCTRAADVYSVGYVMLSAALGVDLHAAVLQRHPELTAQQWGQALDAACAPLRKGSAARASDDPVQALLAEALEPLRHTDPAMQGFIVNALAADPAARPTTTRALTDLHFDEAELREQDAAWAATHFTPEIARAVEDAKALAARVRALQPDLSY